VGWETEKGVKKGKGRRERNKVKEEA